MIEARRHVNLSTVLRCCKPCGGTHISGTKRVHACIRPKDHDGACYWSCDWDFEKMREIVEQEGMMPGVQVTT